MRSQIVLLTRRSPLSPCRPRPQHSEPLPLSVCDARSMRPPAPVIAVPPLPADLRWVGVRRPPRIEPLVAVGPVLVHFFDFAQLNAVRTLPYLIAWHERYRDAGLALLGVHSPRFPFTSSAG